MTATPPAVLDTDMLSEVMRARDPHVLDSAKHYLAEHGRFTFSIITRYEILRGLKAREATRQAALFDRQCARSIVLATPPSLTPEIDVSQETNDAAVAKARARWLT